MYVCIYGLGAASTSVWVRRATALHSVAGAAAAPRTIRTAPSQNAPAPPCLATAHTC